MQNFEDYQVIDLILNDSFVRWASGASNSDDDYWLQAIAVRPHKAEIFDQARIIVQHLQVHPVRDLSNEEVDRMIQKVLLKSKLTAPQSAARPLLKVKWHQTYVFRMAAVALLAITLLTAIWKDKLSVVLGQRNQVVVNKPAFILRTNETSAPIWVRLPDNTSVILKPGSQLKYQNSFAGRKREVYLTGEAFFEVTKNPKKPFFVYANEMTTRVLGTSFMVKAFKGDKDFKVTVSTGKVAVFADAKTAGPVNREASVLVVPNQQAILHRKDAVLVKDDLKKPLILSEVVSKDFFNFNETPFAKVVQSINKAYDINITYNEKKLANCPLTATLTDQPFYLKLDLICKAIEAHYTVDNGEIYIDGTGCRN